MTDGDINGYHFQNKSEILNNLAWTNIEPGIQEPHHLYIIREISSGAEHLRLKLIGAGSLIPVSNDIMKHISNQAAKFSFWENISMLSQLERFLVGGKFSQEH